MAGPQIPSGGFYNDLPPEAQRKILRDFQALAAAVNAIPSEFDAYIDPTLTVDNPGAHTYTCLSTLISHETWGITKTFKVGVKLQAGIAINEQATPANDITGRGDLALFGLGGAVLDVTHVCWNWSTIFTSAAQQVFYYNLPIGGNSASAVTLQNNGVATLDACYVDSHTTGVAVNCAVVARNSRFQAQWFFSAGSQITDYFFDCDLRGGVTVGNLRTFYMQGGVIGVQGGATVTINGTGNAYISADFLANLTVASTVVAATIVNNTGEVGGNVSVTTTTSLVTVTGPWAAVSFTGVSAVARNFIGSGSSMDFTGPGRINYTNMVGGGGSTTKLRGTGVDATINVALGLSIQGIALVHSHIRATFAVAGTFSLDAASHNVLAELAGTWQAGWGGTTDLGANNRIITELGDIVGGAFVPAGARGPQGAPGLDGEDGEPGPPGNSGAAGAAGSTGPPGATSPGSPGLDGEDGFDGMPGPPGATGPTGPSGISIRGQAGEDGEDGFDGMPGQTGATGPQGAVGLSIRGQAGEDGEDGLDGVPGPYGPMGPQGLTGSQGQPRDGMDGEDGFDGMAGPTGPQGAKGVPGPQGPPGVDGEDGQDGLGVAGATGPVGPQGPVGRDGPPGADGDDGVDGINGLQANQSPPGVITMYGGAVAPSGWLLCQGQSLLRTDYASLFDVIGVVYGTVDGTHFTLPNMQEAFPLGKGATHALGATGGATTHSHGVGTLVNSTSSVTGVTGTNAAPTFTGNAVNASTITLTVPALNLSGTGWADIANQAGGGVVAAKQVAQSFTSTIHWTVTLTAADATARSNAIDLGGTTATGSISSGTITTTATGTVTAPVWTYGAGSGTAGAQTISGSTATVTGPVDPFVTVNFIIKF